MLGNLGKAHIPWRMDGFEARRVKPQGVAMRNSTGTDMSTGVPYRCGCDSSEYGERYFPRSEVEG